MDQSAQLPSEFFERLASLEQAYLAHDDPIRQSGYGGGPVRWRAEREPLLDAIAGDGDIADIGCANGYLLECLVEWGHERGVVLTPYGIDYGEQLIQLARRRLPQWADHFFVGNGWDWQPARPFRYAYTLYDTVPPEFLAAYIARLLDRVVAPGGRLILGAYGSRSRGLAPFDIAGFVRANGFEPAGQSQGGTPPLANFAWVDRPPAAA